MERTKNSSRKKMQGVSSSWKELRTRPGTKMPGVVLDLQWLEPNVILRQRQNNMAAATLLHSCFARDDLNQM